MKNIKILLMNREILIIIDEKTDPKTSLKYKILLMNRETLKLH